MKYIVIAAAERLLQNGKIISIWKNSGVIFLKKTGKIMYWIFAKHVMINGAAVLQAQNKILAGENPCFFFGGKEEPNGVFCGKMVAFVKMFFLQRTLFFFEIWAFFLFIPWKKWYNSYEKGLVPFEPFSIIIKERESS